ncbi:hypothetical protein LKD23_05270 [Faecalibacterium sp. CLA-AA-H233]|uniref:Carbohydrate-binding domain-containing protein n=1 Tax=Faecalibacterium butyricigenerans TaxID=1851427 RepID=A0ABS8F7F2_9FIRM|nr:hypothetical protein [Faecalibacterium sp. CLA-AA-H233]MCC2199171.1 hypothetical protein [Faecalibacterium sp. CLA-AA-H233]
MRLKSALRRGVAAAVIAGIVVSSGIPAYAGTWNIADGDITVKAGDAEGPNNVKQGDNDFVKDEGDTVITGKSDEHTVTIDTSEGNVDVTFDDLKIDVSGKKEGNGSDDSPVRESNAAVTVQGDHDATIELDGKNELKSGSYNAGLEKNEHESEGTLTIKDDKGKDGSLTAEGGDGGAGIGGGKESTGSNITIRGGTVEAVGGSSAAGIGDGAYRASDDTDDPNPGKLYICGDAEVTAKAGSQVADAKVPAIGGSYGEVPTEALSDADHKVTGGRLTRLNADGTEMEGMGYDYTSTPTPQPEEDEDDDDDDPPPAQENAPEPLPGGMVVKGFFSSRVTIQRLDGETRDDLSERFRELWIPEVEEWLILTHEHEEVERKTSEELRRELDELLKQKREMDFQLAKKRDDHPSLDWWLEPAREETPRIGLDESLKQLASQFEDTAPEEDKPLLVPVYSPRTERLSRSDGIA